MLSGGNKEKLGLNNIFSVYKEATTFLVILSVVTCMSFDYMQISQ